MTRPTITLYSTTACSSCVRAKQLLDRSGLPFVEINASRDRAGRERLVELTGRMTFPQVTVGDTVIGGFQELTDALAGGRIAELLGDGAE